MSIFIKNGYFCLVERNQHEVPECYNYRGNLIVNQQPKNQKEFDNYIKLSNYSSNMKFLGCRYSKQIENDCNKMLFNDQS
jgi:hypothetical protein